MWDYTFQTGLKATLWGMQAVFPHMRDTGGKIINFGSGNGIGAMKGTAAYNATKEAIRSLTRTAAAEWGKYGIYVNVIIPTMVTDSAHDFFEARDRASRTSSWCRSHCAASATSTATSARSRSSSPAATPTTSPARRSTSTAARSCDRDRVRKATMNDRLRQLVDPAHTAVVTMELQKGIVADESILPAMPERGARGGPARGRRPCRPQPHVRSGVRVVHATMRERPDGAGQAINCRIFAIGAKYKAEHGYSPTEIGQPGVELVDELDVQPSDIEVPRMHGMTPFTGTELDAVIRNLGVTTIVLMGVSLNLGIIGAALSALDHGYQVVVVRDAVVGIPKEYGEMVLQNSIAMIATDRHRRRADRRLELGPDRGHASLRDDSAMAARPRMPGTQVAVIGDFQRYVAMLRYDVLLELLRRLDRAEDARAAYDRALELVHSDAERLPRASAGGLQG